MKRELFLQSCHNHCRIATTGAKCLTICHRMTFGTFMTVCMRKYTPSLLPEGYIVYWCDCLGTPFCDICFIWSEFIIYATIINYKFTSIFSTVNLTLKV